MKVSDVQLGKIGANFGTSTALSSGYGTLLAVGVQDSDLSYKGAVYLFEKRNGCVVTVAENLRYIRRCG